MTTHWDIGIFVEYCLEPDVLYYILDCCIVNNFRNLIENMFSMGNFAEYCDYIKYNWLSIHKSENTLPYNIKNWSPSHRKIINSQY